MSRSDNLEERLNQLGQEVSAPSSLVSAVMTSIEFAKARPRLRQRTSPGFWTISAVSVAACALIAIGVWFTLPKSLYARTLQALNEAQTVHVTGWTTHVGRKWPLEQAQQQSEPRRQLVDAWYWKEDDDTPRSYEKFGPVIQVREGGILREYQQDADLLFIAEGVPKDYVERFSTLTKYLGTLERQDMVKQTLGPREENGKTLHGLKIVHHNRTEEYWFDAQTDLPVRASRSQSEHDGTTSGFEMHFAYNDPVPSAVSGYAPPETNNVRYGGGHQNVQLAWRKHVQDIGIRLRAEPLEGNVAILQRGERQTFAAQWRLKTPSGEHWVIPLDNDQYFPLTLKNFINLRVATEDGERAFETWRIPEDLLEFKFPRSDLVYAVGTSWQEWVQYVLNEHELEFVDVVERRTFWIAHQDGRELKPWKEVEPPVPYLVEGGEVKKGVVRPGIGHQLAPETIHGLFEDFNRIQNNTFTADHPIIVDETGLPKAPEWDRDEYGTYQEYREQVLEKYFVATDSPYFAREESRQMARDWYEREFGVQFTEEQRTMTTHVVRRKE